MRGTSTVATVIRIATRVLERMYYRGLNSYQL